jgi:hypothetical protein
MTDEERNPQPEETRVNMEELLAGVIQLLAESERPRPEFDEAVAKLEELLRKTDSDGHQRAS